MKGTIDQRTNKISYIFLEGLSEAKSVYRPVKAGFLTKLVENSFPFTIIPKTFEMIPTAFLTCALYVRME